MNPSPVLRAAAALSLVAVALTACSDDSDSAADSSGGGGGEITIVASTNVYGDIASAVAGDLASVTSIITSSAQDPHEYEASAQDRLAFDDADVVIENGGGFDPFVDTLLEDSGSGAVVLNAVEISGLVPEEGEEHEEEAHEDEEAHEEEEGHEGHDHIEGFNEHVWYDFHSVEAVAEEISHQLGELDPDNAATYTANYEAFAEEVEGLEAAAEELHATAKGQGVAITEPVPLYLLSEVGLENLTPDEFSEAVEEGADVPARVLQETLDLFSGGQVAVLAYNAQTEDATTEQVREAAEAAGVPVVEFTETLPDGQSYVEWQQGNLDNLAAALG